jgi:hypothetical protein
MKTIAQQINWDFATNGDLEIKDKNGNMIYYEDGDELLEKREWDSEGNEIYYEDSKGFWEKQEYDAQGNEIYYENSKGFWEKQEYDVQCNIIYYENSNGEIIDKRLKTCDGKVVEIDGIKYKLTKL